MGAVRAGIVGCGNISGAYLRYSRMFDIVDIVACSDLDIERAKAKAAEYGVPRVLPLDQLFDDPSIELVINLTIPAAHTEVNLQALSKGKHVYVEKPLAITREDGRQVLKTADDNGLLVGCAPDTVLGAGIQTARKLVDDGAIGRPLSAVAFMMCPGHEGWHPDPEFYYKAGGGPLFDMGPYYLTALIQLFGPISSVRSSAATAFKERIIGSEPKKGTVFPVETPTHISANLTFKNGELATIIMSFDVFGRHDLPNIEIFGTEGSIRVPDPNEFNGEVKLSRRLQPDSWETVALTHPYADSGRSLGVADMAYAIRNGRAHRANGEVAFHVLDVMHSILESASIGSEVQVASTCTRPAAMSAEGLFC